MQREEEAAILLSGYQQITHFLFKINIKLQATIREMTRGHAKDNIKVKQR